MRTDTAAGMNGYKRGATLRRTAASLTATARCPYTAGAAAGEGV